MTERPPFSPDWVSPPGDTIAAILNERGVTLADFASRVKCSVDQANDLLHGDLVVTEDLAARLATALGCTASFWKRREEWYRWDLRRLTERASSADAAAWLCELPLRDMKKLGWISAGNNQAEVAAACMRFFGVAAVTDWRHTYAEPFNSPAFRTSKAFASEPGAVAAWLRRGEILASEIDCGSWDMGKFREELQRLRALTREEDPDEFVPELVKRCAACGVAVVVLRAPKNCSASGAARFLTPERPMILLSGRHLTDDHFWFTFYHEAGHLVLHGHKFVFVDTLPGDDGLSGKDEDGANQFASDLLIPQEHQGELMRLTANKIAVMRFAKRIGVSRGIVVGQLQHREVIPRNYLNGLKYRFKWADE
jgi:Zn-dependent peptidase ImmA (M78 family)/plasmid maintenance system antidote protein VapI